MIANCYGCIYEFETAIDYVKRGYHLATMKHDSSENIFSKGHFFFIIVDNNGNKIVW